MLPLIEFRRYWSRRMPYVTMLVITLVIVGGVVIAYFTMGDDGFAATEVLGGQTDDWSQYRAEFFERSEGSVRGDTFEYGADPLTGFLPTTAGLLFTMLAVVVGGSFIGAEYRFGTLENLLLWEPRRLRVIGAKFVGGALASAVFVIAMSVVLTLLLLALAAMKGDFDGVDGRYWSDVVGVIVRAGIAGAGFFAIAMGIATITKNTAAAVVALLGWFVVSQIITDLLLRWFRPFEPWANSYAFIGDGDMFKWQRIAGEWQSVFSHGYLLAGVIVALWAVVVGGVATVVFLRRDVS